MLNKAMTNKKTKQSKTKEFTYNNAKKEKKGNRIWYSK